MVSGLRGAVTAALSAALLDGHRRDLPAARNRPECRSWPG